MPTTKRCPFNSNPHSLIRFDDPSRVPIPGVEFRGFDTLVNSAGVLSIGPIDELSLKDFDRTIAVNVRAVFVANVLVTEVNGRPMPKVIDFGVAKATEQKLTDMSFADVGAIVGTPAYMAPEQADPSSMDIDTRTDVYALGVMLYELLTGSPPIASKQFKRGAILEMLRMVPTWLPGSGTWPCRSWRRP